MCGHIWRPLRNVFRRMGENCSSPPGWVICAVTIILLAKKTSQALLPRRHLQVGHHRSTCIKFTGWMASEKMEYSFLSVTQDGTQRLAYRLTEGNSPAVLFCPGFQSTMEGEKALALERLCVQRGSSYCRFDYRGHGASTGEFKNCTLSDWIDDASSIITETLESHRQIIVIGSSMGGWIACHLALRYPTKIAGIIGIAAAPDFLQDIFEEASASQWKEFETRGFLTVSTKYSSSPYHFSRDLLKDAQKWAILSKEVSKSKIAIQCPVHLFHGQQDEDIPWSKSVDLMNRLQSERVVLNLIKCGDHRLSRPQDLDRICNALVQMIKEQHQDNDE